MLRHSITNWKHSTTFQEYKRNKYHIAQLTITDTNLQKWFHTSSHKGFLTCYRRSREVFEAMTGYYLLKQLPQKKNQQGFYEKKELEIVYSTPDQTITYQEVPRKPDL